MVTPKRIGAKAELLLSLCKEVGATDYISPPGSREYLEPNNLLQTNGVEAVYHNFRYPEYRQMHGTFLPYLSTVDLVLNEGPSSLRIIRSGRMKHETSNNRLI